MEYRKRHWTVALKCVSPVSVETVGPSFVTYCLNKIGNGELFLQRSCPSPPRFQRTSTSRPWWQPWWWSAWSSWSADAEGSSYTATVSSAVSLPL